MSDELKPVRCGCGGDVEIIKHPNGKYTVSCTRGGCMANVGWCPDEKTAITAWNRAMGATDTNVGDKIIYCKDCKYSHMTIDGLCKYCDIWFPNEEMYEDGKYFCASAEKRML